MTGRRRWRPRTALPSTFYFDALEEGKLRAGDDSRIVCEHHEDWVVVRAVRATARLPERMVKMPMSTDDYLTSADSTLARADHFGEPEKAHLIVAEAQVTAIQAVAAAISRLAKAVENLQR